MTTRGTDDGAGTDDGVYHIVCHDCPAEFLASEGPEAERRLSEHRSSTGHNVDFAALSRVEVEGE